ncbi:MAG: S8 family serine peptidase, partial [Clostridia bacterium]|nr:S8 family serine peptidase [Clostridia bacterium]
MTTKKIFSSMLATLMAIALILTGFTSAVQADDMIGAEDTVISTPTESECSFADNRVLVALTREASLAFSSYSVEDFSDIGCIKVTDLSDSAATMTKDALHQASILLTTGESTAFFEVQNKNKNVVSNYKQILCLELENPGRENVLAAVSLLQQRDDVYCAEPDYILVFEDIDENEGNLSSASVDYIGKPTSWAYDIIQTDDAYGLLWNITPATVGIIDTGIDGDHPLLQDAINVELCRDFSTGVEVATGVPTDSYGHGTMIAGIIAAQGGGVYSICPTAQLVSLRIASNYDNSPVVSYAI